MALVPRILAALSLTRLPWVASAQDALAGPPLEFAAANGELFQTADGIYFGVLLNGSVSSPGRLYGRLLNNAGRSRYQFFRHSMGDTCFSARCGIC